MKGGRWPFAKSSIRYLQKHTCNASMAAETRHQPRFEQTIHGRQCPRLQIVSNPLPYADHALGYRKSSFHVSWRSVQLVKFAVEGCALGPLVLKNAQVIVPQKQRNPLLRPLQDVSRHSILKRRHKYHKPNILVSLMAIMIGWTANRMFMNGKA